MFFIFIFFHHIIYLTLSFFFCNFLIIGKIYSTICYRNKKKIYNYLLRGFSFCGWLGDCFTIFIIDRVHQGYIHLWFIIIFQTYAFITNLTFSLDSLKIIIEGTHMRAQQINIEGGGRSCNFSMNQGQTLVERRIHQLAFPWHVKKQDSWTTFAWTLFSYLGFSLSQSRKRCREIKKEK